MDSLLALPNPFEMLPLVKRWTTLGLFIPALLLAACIQALALITILAPNALTIVPKGNVYHTLEVPTLDFSAGPVESIDGMGRRLANESLPTSLKWNRIVQKSAISGRVPTWPSPKGCGSSCNYNFTYVAPALKCLDQPFSRNYTLDFLVPLYNATIEFFSQQYYYERHGGVISPHPNPGVAIEWLKADGMGVNLIGSRIECTFHNATYQADVTYGNGTQITRANVTDWGILLNDTWYDYYLDHHTNTNVAYSLAPDVNYGLNAAAAFNALGKVLNGTLTGTHEVNGYTSNLPSVYNNRNHEMQIMNTGLFQDPIWEAYWTFDKAVPHLATALTDLFTNVTLGFVAEVEHTTTVEAVTIDDRNIWSYQPRTLWLIYGNAFLTSFLFCLYGLWCIHQNGEAVDQKFSFFVLTTRNPQLDETVEATTRYKDVLNVPLIYAKRSVFHVETEGKSL